MLRFKFYGNVFGIDPGNSLIINNIGCKKMQVWNEQLENGEGKSAANAKIVE